MICQKCGKEISDNITLCPYCGAKSGETPDNTAPKKKSKKAAFILRSLAAVMAAAIVIICIILPNREIHVELTDEYSDIERGFSFKQPSDWQISTSDNEIVLLKEPDGAAEIKVTEYSDDIVDLFTVNSVEVKSLFTESDSFIEFSDTVLGNTLAKMLVYQTESENGRKRVVKRFCYEAGYNKYSVICSYEAPYENAVNEIMASFTADSAAPANTIAPNEIIYRKTPINRLLEYSPNEIKEAFGEPLRSTDSVMLYDNLSFFFDKDSSIIEGIHIKETEALSIQKYPDSTFEELSKLNTESDDKTNILKDELGVEPTIYSYQQGVYKFEYDLSDYTMFTVFEEYSNVPHAAWFINAKPVSNNKICYNGISVNTLFELSYDDVLNIYGEPSINSYASSETYGGEGYLYETLYFPSENITYTFSRENGKVSIIEGISDNFITVNGSKLSEDPNEFSKAFGEAVVSNSYGELTGFLYTLPEYKSLDVISDREGTIISVKLKSKENRIPYNIDTLASLMLCEQEDVLLALGAPKHEPPVRGYEMYDAWEYYVYNDELEVDFKVDNPINAYEIAFLPQCVEKNGKTLDKTVDDLQAILGNPCREGYYPDGYYYVEYNLQEYGLWEYEMRLHLEMPNYNSKASLGYLYMYREEDYYTEPEPEPEPEVSYSYTADGYTVISGSTVYAKEGLFGLNYAEGYVQSIDGDTATVAWKYIYVNGLWAYSKYELYSTNEIFIGNTYNYYNSNGEKMSTVGVKNKSAISELYAQIPSGETVFNGIALEY